jgi:hypothetical protein
MLLRFELARHFSCSKFQANDLWEGSRTVPGGPAYEIGSFSGSGMRPMVLIDREPGGRAPPPELIERLNRLMPSAP